MHALGTPLITKSDGTKFGKTAEGALWLDRELMSPYAFFQFWLNVEDGDASTLLARLQLQAPRGDRGARAAHCRAPAAREAQRALAEEMTTLVHGEDETARVVAASRALFGQGDLAELDVDTLSAALTRGGSRRAGRRRKLRASPICFASTGLVRRKSAARRTIDEGGAYVNNERVTDADAVLSDADFVARQWAVLRRGKRSVAGVVASDRRVLVRTLRRLPHGDRRMATHDPGLTRREHYLLNSAHRLPGATDTLGIHLRVAGPAVALHSHVRLPRSFWPRPWRATWEGAIRVDLTRSSPPTKLGELPQNRTERSRVGARSFLENSTVCRKSMPKTPSVGHRLSHQAAPGRYGGIPLVKTERRVIVTSVLARSTRPVFGRVPCVVYLASAR